MKKIVAVIIVVALLLLTGCQRVDSGTVINKSYSPAHKTYQPMVMVMNKHMTVIPRWINHAASWSILVENDDVRDWWSVSKEYYESVEVGDHVSR